MTTLDETTGNKSKELAGKPVKSWEFPYVEDDKPVDLSRTNALNKTSDWKYEPPEEEEEIKPPTAEEIEAIRQAAYEEGFAIGKKEGHEQGFLEGKEQGHGEGFSTGQEEGHAKGLDSGTEEIQQQLAIWKQLTEKLIQPVNQVDGILENELVTLATSLAVSVIRVEVATNKDIIFQALSEGLKVLPIQEKQYQIHLNPEDILLIKEHFSEQEIEKHHWQFIETPDLSRGGCDIVTNSNAVDVSIERRMREVIDKFMLEQGIAQSGHRDLDSETES